MINKVSALSLSVIVGITLLTYFGITQYIFDHDAFLISSVIACIAVVAYIHGLWRPDHSARYAEVCVGLGLLGTVVGFSHGLQFVEASGEAIDALTGAFTAFHTTAVGLSAAMILRIQYWMSGGEL